MSFLTETFASTDFASVYWLEKEIFKLEDLEVGKNLELRNVPIGSNGEYIHVAITGNPENPPLLLLHGFGGSIVFQYKLLKPLSQSFRVYAIDNPGTGLSFRSECNASNNQESIDYFTERIEQLRMALKLEKFSMAGHSFGAYISFFYTLKHQALVSCLFLLSPAGFKPSPASGNEERGQSKIVNFFREKQIVPGELVSVLGPFSKQFISFFLSKRFRMSGRELELFRNYTYAMMRLKVTSDKTVFHILKARATSDNPIAHHVSETQTKIYIYYGQRDWMDPSTARELSKNLPGQVHVKYVRDAGHQMGMENPKGVVELMLEDFKLFRSSKSSESPVPPLSPAP